MRKFKEVPKVLKNRNCSFYRILHKMHLSAAGVQISECGETPSLTVQQSKSQSFTCLHLKTDLEASWLTHNARVGHCQPDNTCQVSRDLEKSLTLRRSGTSMTLTVSADSVVKVLHKATLSCWESNTHDRRDVCYITVDLTGKFSLENKIHFSIAAWTNSV